MTMIYEHTVPWVTVESEYALELAAAWIKSKKEHVAAAGWRTYAGLATIEHDENLDLALYKRLLDEVEEGISTAKNRVKSTMNGFVISVGSYVKPLHAQAMATGKRVGPSQSTSAIRTAKSHSRPSTSPRWKPPASSARREEVSAAERCVVAYTVTGTACTDAPWSTVSISVPSNAKRLKLAGCPGAIERRSSMPIILAGFRDAACVTSAKEVFVKRAKFATAWSRVSTDPASTPLAVALP